MRDLDHTEPHPFLDAPDGLALCLAAAAVAGALIAAPLLWPYAVMGAVIKALNDRTTEDR